jgi:hypothetical protein
MMSLPVSLPDRYRRLLFARGYLITRQELLDSAGAPFFGHWRRQSVGSWYLHTHAETSVATHVAEDGNVLFLVGHAYDPFNGTESESELLARAAGACAASESAMLCEVGNWTGRFVLGVISGKVLKLVQDCAGLRTAYYGEFSGTPWVASHAQLIADLCGLVMDPCVSALVNSSAYAIGIRFLPGNISPFSGVKRLGPNTVLDYREGFSVRRFYPHPAAITIRPERELPGVVESIATVLDTSLSLIARKWRNPAISMTGGTDSQTTLAATRSSRDAFRYFSFNSSQAEWRDVDAAGRLCGSLGLRHERHDIPEAAALPDFDAVVAVLRHNSAYVRRNAGNDLRKLAYFAQTRPYDVDVKSWVSEVGRAFFCARLGVDKLPDRLTARHLSNLYKRIFFDRRLLGFVDDAFDKWMQEIDFDADSGALDKSDMVYWEHRVPAWGALGLNEFDMCWETTVPYNNRRLLEMFLSFPRHLRARDHAHKEVVRLFDPALANLGVHVENDGKQRRRIMLERVFFEVNSRLP